MGEQSHTQTQLYIFFIYLNMKYTFYRCFTLFLSVHRSPKMCMPKGHSYGLQWGGWRREEGNGSKVCALHRKGQSAEPTSACLALVHMLETPQREERAGLYFSGRTEWGLVPSICHSFPLIWTVQTKCFFLPCVYVTSKVANLVRFFFFLWT